MKFKFILLIIIQCSCTSIKVIEKVETLEPIAKETQHLSATQILNRFENKVLGGCPISKGPAAVVEYLDQVKGFHRNINKESRGSIRFNAKDTEIYGRKLFNEKSLFLLNFNQFNNVKLLETTYDSWFQFQAAYWFENEEDQESLYRYLMEILNHELKLERTVKADIEGTKYWKYLLPNVFHFNLKRATRDGKHIIDIIWSPIKQR